MKTLMGALATVLALAFLAAASLMTVLLVDSKAKTIASDGGGGLQGVPAEFREWILKADSACAEPEMTPALLASQLWTESKFKTSQAEATSWAGAQGPAQFIPGTWATWGVDADGNGRNSPWDIGDAVTAQGRMMCSLLGQAKRSGYGGDPRALALAGYNAGWGAVERYGGVPPQSFSGGETHGYVQSILAEMHRFEGPGALQVSGTGAGPDALRRAATRLGTPYSYGGGTPSGPTTGFCDGVNGYLNGGCNATITVGYDCSSLVQYAYWPTTKLPRTAAEQYGATSHHAVSRNELQPGDLLFWIKGGFIYHVGMYAGDGNVLHAPRTGKVVEIVPLASAMPERDYLGATRP